MKTTHIEITSNEQLLDITQSVRDYISEIRLKDGFVHIQIPERTSAVSLSVNDNWRLEKEFFNKINHLLPKYDGMKFTGWTTANVKASIFGMTIQIMVQDGTLILDKNQSIYFVEFQGPGERQYFMSSVGTTLLENEKPEMPNDLKILYKTREKFEAEQEKIKEEMRNEWKLCEEKRLLLEKEKEKEIEQSEE
ncbi:YjbQ family protein [Acetobacterium tundrae]|uniref:YjbQ family protein n=1 Tax=Acetobacterium tundrae TaxID=132932 RepID=A0ABR6WPC3_9FIRM|nr:YjbQ family protein [Acetobacterium tundrae]MBC3798339.1 hypothetical protein [Acetobacterium tundrae]